MGNVFLPNELRLLQLVEEFRGGEGSENLADSVNFLLFLSEKNALKKTTSDLTKYLHIERA